MIDIVSVLHEVRPEHDFTASDDFITDGLLDSFDIVVLVSLLEEKYGLVIDGEDIIPEYFINIDALGQLLKRYAGDHES